MASGSTIDLTPREAVQVCVTDRPTAPEKPARSKRKTVIMRRIRFTIFAGAEYFQQPPLALPSTEEFKDVAEDSEELFYSDEFDDDAYDDICFSNRKRGNHFCRSTSRNKPPKTEPLHLHKRAKVEAKRKLERARANIVGNRIAEKSNIDARLSTRGLQRLGLELYHRRAPARATAKQATYSTPQSSSTTRKNRHPSSSPCRQKKEDHPATVKYTLHEDNVPTESCDLAQLLIDIQHRDISPEDYELLLRLDDTIAPKTIPRPVLCSIHVVTVDIAGIVGDLCSICMELYQTSHKVKTLPCSHTFHADCIDLWLTNSSHKCPLDGLAVAS